MHTSTCEFERGFVAEGRIRLFSLYVDYAAAERARWVTSQIARLVGGHWKTSTEIWNLDLLTTASEPMRKMIPQEATTGVKWNLFNG
jgi:hypothetical protein